MTDYLFLELSVFKTFVMQSRSGPPVWRA